MKTLMLVLVFVSTEATIAFCEPGAGLSLKNTDSEAVLLSPEQAQQQMAAGEALESFIDTCTPDYWDSKKEVQVTNPCWTDPRMDGIPVTGTTWRNVIEKADPAIMNIGITAASDNLTPVLDVEYVCNRKPTNTGLRLTPDGNPCPSSPSYLTDEILKAKDGAGQTFYDAFQAAGYDPSTQLTVELEYYTP